MKVKTAELTGAALRWAVAQAEEQPVKIITYGAGPLVALVDPSGWTRGQYHPDVDGSQGVPIMERELIGVAVELSFARQVWMATIWPDYSKPCTATATGPTLLVAAMRCRVAAKFGDEVEIPNELT